MTCKDCLHYEACKGTYMSAQEYEALADFDGEHFADTYHCPNFTNKSEWIHLPCKTGDTIFMPWRWNGENGIAQITVLQIVLTEDGSYVETDLESDDYDYFMYYNGGRFWFDDFGIMVFPTKEEAEKSLKERRKNLV